jgi:TPR repeat protein
MYATGQGTTRDDTVAIAWYQLAADQGDAQAQYNLGVMIANGLGTGATIPLRNNGCSWRLTKGTLRRFTT